MIGFILFALGCLLGLAIGISVQRGGRSAADPDKETPPPGWKDPRSATTTKTNRRATLRGHYDHA